MGSRVFFGDAVSDVSGYRTAFVDMKDPNDTTTATTFTTNTSGSGDNIEMTDSAGGTATNWITKPFFADVTIDGSVFMNLWGLESNASANATFGVRLAEYTTSEQSNFLDNDNTTELTTSAALSRWITAAPSSTTIDAGNRLVIDLRIVPVGTMGGSQTVDFNFADSETDVDGDSFLMLSEQVRVNEAQVGTGTSLTITGKNVGAFQEFIDFLNAYMDILFTEDETVRALVDDLEFIRDNH